MKDRRTKYDEDFKKNAVALSYASPRSVREISEDLGITEGLLYRWRKKYTKDGEKTKFSAMEDELKATKRELAEARIELDMLKKAAAYFASLHRSDTRS